MKKADGTKKKRNPKKTILTVVIIVAVLSVAQMGVLGAMGGLGPLSFLRDNIKAKLPGNAEQYHPENVTVNPDSPLQGKRLFFLGSSVTRGSAALQKSAADYLAAVDGCIVTKDAVNGTTLVDQGPYSYVKRLKNHGADEQYDAVIVQLSTNDASKKAKLGAVSEGKDGFDTQTIIGAMEEIIQYAQETWNCPVLFYTGTHYDSELYQQMVDALGALQEKWGIGVIDLWNDAEMNAVSAEDYAFYMDDKIHPTQAGYYLWWLPRFEASLTEVLA